MKTTLEELASAVWVLEASNETLLNYLRHIKPINSQGGTDEELNDISNHDNETKEKVIKLISRSINALEKIKTNYSSINKIDISGTIIG